ncbi:MAG: PAS domain-containing protein [Rhodoferax sp.]|nr:PAS domain-containing protein [Rhodoferax sp.]
MTDSSATTSTLNLSGSSVDPSLFFEASPVATFVIDKAHVVTHFNQACALTLDITAARALGHKDIGKVFYGDDRPMMVDLIVDGLMEQAVNDLYQSSYRSSLKVPHAYEAEHFFLNLGNGGRWLFFTAAPIYNKHGELVGAIETVQDITERKVAEEALMKAQLEVEQIVEQRTSELAAVNQTLREDVNRREAAEHELLKRNDELQTLYTRLSEVKEHLIQSEKLASIGQLAAGIAHEINNPIGYIFSNFGTLENYLAQLFNMLDAYEKAETDLQSCTTGQTLKGKREAFDLEFLKEDIPVLMRESKEGIVRVRKIVQDLKDFSHVDTNSDWQFASLNQGIDSTLNVINNEIKYKADLVKEFADLPELQCMPSQINQVVMNLVVNAAHAIGPERGKITVRTGQEGEQVWLEVTDTGSGIPPDVLPRIFDPFYTTKPIGKGTGLGLSLSYGIIQKHHGKIEVNTNVGQGTSFKVWLPLKQPAASSPMSNP